MDVLTVLKVDINSIHDLSCIQWGTPFCNLSHKTYFSSSFEKRDSSKVTDTRLKHHIFKGRAV